MGIQYSIFKENKKNFFNLSKIKSNNNPWIKVYLFNQELKNQIYKNSLFKKENFKRIATLGKTHLSIRSKNINIKNSFKEPKIKYQKKKEGFINLRYKKILNSEVYKNDFVMVNKINKVNLLEELNIIYSFLNEFSIIINKITNKSLNQTNFLNLNQFLKNKKKNHNQNMVCLFNNFSELKLERIYLNLFLKYKLQKNNLKYRIDYFNKNVVEIFKNQFLLKKPILFSTIDILKYWLFYIFNKKNKKLLKFDSINKDIFEFNFKKLELYFFNFLLQPKKNLRNNFQKSVKKWNLTQLKFVKKSQFQIKFNQNNFNFSQERSFKKEKSNNLIKNLFYKYWLVNFLKSSLLQNYNTPFVLVNEKKSINYLNKFNFLTIPQIQSLETFNKKSNEKLNLNNSLFLAIRKILYSIYLNPKFIFHFKIDVFLNQTLNRKNLKKINSNKRVLNFFFIQPFIIKKIKKNLFLKINYSIHITHFNLKSFTNLITNGTPGTPFFSCKAEKSKISKAKFEIPCDKSCTKYLIFSKKEFQFQKLSKFQSFIKLNIDKKLNNKKFFNLLFFYRIKEQNLKEKCILNLIWDLQKSNYLKDSIVLKNFNFFKKLKNKTINKLSRAKLIEFKKFYKSDLLSIKLFQIFNQSFFLRQSKNYFLLSRLIEKSQIIFKMKNYILAKKNGNLINKNLMLYLPINLAEKTLNISKPAKKLNLKLNNSKQEFFLNRKEIKNVTQTENGEKSIKFFQKIKLLNPIFKIKLHLLFLKLYAGQNYFFKKLEICSSITKTSLNNSTFVNYDQIKQTKLSFINIYINYRLFLKRKIQFFFPLRENFFFKINKKHLKFLNKNFLILIYFSKNFFYQKQNSILSILKKSQNNFLNKNIKIFKNKKIKNFVYFFIFKQIQIWGGLNTSNICLFKNKISYFEIEQIKNFELIYNLKEIRISKKLKKIDKAKLVLLNFLKEKKLFLRKKAFLKSKNLFFYKSTFSKFLFLNSFFSSVLNIPLKLKQFFIFEKFYFYFKFNLILKNIKNNNFTNNTISMYYRNFISIILFLIQPKRLIRKDKNLYSNSPIKRFLFLLIEKQLQFNSLKFLTFLDCSFICQKIFKTKFKLINWTPNISLKPLGLKNQLNIIKYFLFTNSNLKTGFKFFHKLYIKIKISSNSSLCFLLRQNNLIVKNSYFKKRLKFKILYIRNKNSSFNFKNFKKSSIFNFLLISQKSFNKKQLYFYYYFLKISPNYFIFNPKKINDYCIKLNLFNTFFNSFFKQTLRLYGIILKNEIKTSSLYYGENLLFFHRNLNFFLNYKNILNKFLNKFSLILKKKNLFFTTELKNKSKIKNKKIKSPNKATLIRKNGFSFYGFYIFQEMYKGKNFFKLFPFLKDFNNIYFQNFNNNKIYNIEFSFFSNSNISNPLKLFSQFNFISIKPYELYRLKTNKKIQKNETIYFSNNLNKFKSLKLKLYRNQNINFYSKNTSILKKYFYLKNLEDMKTRINLNHFYFLKTLLKKKTFFKLNLLIKSKNKKHSKKKFLISLNKTFFYNKDKIKKQFFNSSYLFINEINLDSDLKKIIKTNKCFQIEIKNYFLNQTNFFSIQNKDHQVKPDKSFYKYIYIKREHFKNLIYNPFETKVFPIKENLKSHTNQIRNLFFKLQGNKQEILIKNISPIIHKWCHYYKPFINFNYLNFLLVKILWNWCFKRHNNVSNFWIKEKYFVSLNNKKYRFSVSIKTQLAYEKVVKESNYLRKNKTFKNQKYDDSSFNLMPITNQSILLKTNKFLPCFNLNRKNNLKLTNLQVISNKMKKIRFIVIGKYV